MSPLSIPTLIIGVVAAALSYFLRPGRALGLLLVCLLVWPEYHRMPMGLAQMSAPRIVAAAIVLRLALVNRRGRFNWNVVDKLCLGLWAWLILATILVGADDVHINYQIGRGLDTVLMYFAARLALREKRDYQDLVAPVAILSCYLCLIGLIEAATGNPPYGWMYQLRTTVRWAKPPEYRLGFLRAKGSTLQYIYWGMALFLLTGMQAALVPLARKRWLATVGVAAAFVGALTSLSSGPMLSLAALLVFSLFGRVPRLIKPALIGLVLLSAFLELASNRHFYSLIDYLSLSTGNAWYRTKLIEVAVANLNEYWAFGVGEAWPNHWGMQVDGRLHVDVVNHFLILALYGGVLAFVLYVWMHVSLLRDLTMKWRATASRREKTAIFGIAATLLALAAGSMSVGLFGPPLILSFILMGSIAGLPSTDDAASAVRMVRVVHRVKPPENDRSQGQ